MVIATLIAVAIDPGGWGVVAVVAILAYCTYAVFPASFTAGTALLTSVIVFLLHAVSPDSVQTALDRGIDTAIGGAIGLIAYALWPTWSALSAGPLLAKLVDAQHSYLDAVLTGLTTGRRLPETQLRTLAREARVAFMDAEAAIGLARSEPHRGDTDLETTATTLAALRRVVRGVHVLRLDAATMPAAPACASSAPLQAGLGDAPVFAGGNAAGRRAATVSAVAHAPPRARAGTAGAAQPGAVGGARRAGGRQPTRPRRRPGLRDDLKSL